MLLFNPPIFDFLRALRVLRGESFKVYSLLKELPITIARSFTQ